jgi:hypothetical protein
MTGLSERRGDPVLSVARLPARVDVVSLSLILDDESPDSDDVAGQKVNEEFRDNCEFGVYRVLGGDVEGVLKLQCREMNSSKV